jgi:hypothetical protein
MENKDKLNFAVEKMLEGWLEVLPAIKQSVKDAALEAVEELADDIEFVEAFADAIKEKTSQVDLHVTDKFLPSVELEDSSTLKTRKKPHPSVPLDDIVSPGDVLTWKDDSDITCIVTQNPKFVVFEDEITTINRAMKTILTRKGLATSVNARGCWCLNGQKLTDIILENRKKDI